MIRIKVRTKPCGCCWSWLCTIKLVFVVSVLFSLVVNFRAMPRLQFLEDFETIIQPPHHLQVQNKHSLYNEKEYQIALHETLKSLPGGGGGDTPPSSSSSSGGSTSSNVSSVETGWHVRHFYSGLNNQVQRFIGVVLVAQGDNLDQIIEQSLVWKDTMGTDSYLRHYKLWDIVHWNTYYPLLPRIVTYDKRLHVHLTLQETNVTINDNDGGGGDDDDTAKRTTPIGEQHQVQQQQYPGEAKGSYNVTWDVWGENRRSLKPIPFVQGLHQALNYYKKLHKHIDSDSKILKYTQSFEYKRLQMYQAMLRGALRPHPFLQGLVEQEKARLRRRSDGSSSGKYMVLHARVEPDMARQDRVCTWLKVWNITNITNAIYSQYPKDPPVDTVLVQFNRDIMESEAKRDKRLTQNDKYHSWNDYNLRELNNLVKNGMWGGKVQVVESGSGLVKGAGDPYYRHYSTIAGGIVNMFLAIEADIFIGTEVSTYSVQAINSRIYRGEKENYFYRPVQLDDDGDTRIFSTLIPKKDKAYRFVC